MDPIRVLIVDDSAFFRKRIRVSLARDKSLRVVGEAVDGRQAIQMSEELEPDVITMDIEMPGLDGIAAVKQILRRRWTPILMFSSATRAGAAATLDALDAGALDFLPKQFEDVAGRNGGALDELSSRIQLLAAHRPPDPGKQIVTKQDRLAGDFSIIGIGASTGGPPVIQKLLAGLPATFPLPVLVVQHMPEAFTQLFAERLDQLSQLHVKQAEHGDVVRPGTVYVAPGGAQMLVRRQADREVLRITAGGTETFKPSVDVTFTSMAETYGAKVLGMVMTGMGNDGCQGALALKQRGATIVAQDRETSAVYGMPKAVVNQGLADAVLPLGELCSWLMQRGGKWIS